MNGRKIKLLSRGKRGGSLGRDQGRRNAAILRPFRANQVPMEFEPDAVKRLEKGAESVTVKRLNQLSLRVL